MGAFNYYYLTNMKLKICFSVGVAMLIKINHEKINVTAAPKYSQAGIIKLLASYCIIIIIPEGGISARC